VSSFSLFTVEMLRRPRITHNGMAAWRQRRLPLPLLRAINVQLRTTVSAGLLPPLRQTAQLAAVFLPCLSNLVS